jgi:uncharacterized protein with NRDE domain
MAADRADNRDAGQASCPRAALLPSYNFVTGVHRRCAKPMCTLAIFLRVFPEFPVVVAANRDEYLARPAVAPTVLCEDPLVIGGKDLRAGGTWLAVNQFGMIAGLLNRRSDLPADPERRSRGLLCLDALRHRSVEQALRFVAAQDPERYNPFNLLLASREQAAVAHNRMGRIETTMLAAGTHLLTNLDVNDFECPKISRSFGKFASLAEERGLASDPPRMRERLAELLSDHSTQLDARTGRPNSLCLHLGDYGTRESSLIFVGAAGRIEHYFAPGPPCTTAYAPASAPEVSSSGT